MSFKLCRSNDSRGDFEAIKVGNFTASIQASYRHYCSPREDLPSSDDYIEFEVALFDKDGNFFNPSLSDKYKNFDWSRHWSAHDDVAGYVPRDNIEMMLHTLSI